MSWIANLSNGDTLVEGKEVAGKRSPWQQLLQLCKDKNIEITGLRLTVGKVTVSAMPTKMCDGYFHAYETTRIFWRDKTIQKQGIGSVVGDKVYITWIDLSPENNMYYAYQEIRPLSEVKIHTTTY